MTNSKRMLVGWREWIALPELQLPAIKVKVDTGARTSAIHAFDIQPEQHQGQEWAAFSVQPLQRNKTTVIRCRAPIVDIRKVSDSGGHVEERLVVATPMTIGGLHKTIEITLSERRSMLFRMLLGRSALVPEFEVDPSMSYVFGRQNARSMYPLTTEELSP